MRLLLCLDGTNTERLFAAARELLARDDLALRLLYVLDSGSVEQAGFWRERYVGRAGLGTDWQARVDAAARTRGEEVLRDAEARLAAAPIPTGRSDATPAAGAPPLAQTLLLAGRPEHEIVRIAGEWPATLVALCARRQDGPPRPAGPHSVGHVARFVTDHAPCPVLLVRP